MMEEDKNYSYADLKYLNKVDKEKYISTYKKWFVPITQRERICLYYKKFPLISSNNPVSKKTETKEKKSISIIDFNNPMGIKKISKEEQFEKTTNKIKNNLPENRTILIMNFDKKYEEELIKRIFNLIGKVRRVFNGEFSQVNKKMFFSILIFKNEIDFYKCFNFKMFNIRVLEHFLPLTRNLSEKEKETRFQDYLKELDGYVDYDKVKEFDDFEDYRGLVKFVDFEEEESKYKIDGIDVRRKKKKYPKEYNNYYKFNSNKKFENKAEEIDYNKFEEIDENMWENEDYLDKRKEILRNKFEKQRKKLEKN